MRFSVERENLIYYAQIDIQLTLNLSNKVNANLLILKPVLCMEEWLPENVHKKRLLQRGSLSLKTLQQIALQITLNLSN